MKDRPFRHVRLGKNLRFTSPYNFMAQRKSVVDEAFPGDVVGLYDRGDLKIGDTLTEGEEFTFRGVPHFSPEIFKELINTDPMRSKQLDKGIAQLSEEGIAQLFIQDKGRRKIVGTVGDLQFDVINYRLEYEYGASCRFEPLSFAQACWITSEDPKKLKVFLRFKESKIAYDLEQKPVYFAETQWMLRTVIEDNPNIEFHFTSEFKTERETLAAR
jgi:peptide chain release factor 3